MALKCFFIIFFKSLLAKYGFSDWFCHYFGKFFWINNNQYWQSVSQCSRLHPIPHTLLFLCIFLVSCMIVCRSYMCTFSLSCSANNRLPPPLINICYLPLIRSRAKATTICAANYSSSGSKALVLTKQSSSFSLEPFSLHFASSVDSAKISFLVSSARSDEWTWNKRYFRTKQAFGCSHH